MSALAGMDTGEQTMTMLKGKTTIILATLRRRPGSSCAREERA
jgi:hypothetical protein